MTEKKAARQTLTGIIRSRMASYQARQLAGELQKTFAAELTDEGHSINYKDFRTLYSRAKKQVEEAEGIQREKRKEISKPVEKIHPDSQPESENTGETNNDTSHRPTDLDAIIHETPNLAALAKLSKRNRK